jgi:hypothetical protein
MSMAKSQTSTTITQDVRKLTDALAGAFVEGVDLGSRGAQIQLLGRTLDVMIEALRLELAHLGDQLTAEVRQLDLDQLTRMAWAAGAYDTGEAEQSFARA